MTVKKSPGRPREFNRELALDAAMLRFWQFGYESTSVTDLREAMGGLSVASLYNSFGNKDQLFRLSVERYRQLPGHVSQVLADETLEPLAAIKFALRSAVLMQTDPEHAFGCLVLLGATNYTAENSEINEYLKTFRKEVTLGVYELLKTARESGALTSPFSDEVLADFFRVVLNGVALQARDGSTTLSLLGVLEVVDEVFV